ncbi:MAG: outer membrane beta-barrel protein [Bacteroidales bacterium]|nr:outer membrane beta-barrel protein [Bacteroidales bacterium]
MRKSLLITAALFVCCLLSAQEAENGYLRYIADTTTKVRNYADINNYSLIGVNYGVTFSQMQFNPSQKQSWLFNPVYVSLMYTHYLKLFQYMPYFGYKVGIAYGKEGYRFKENKDTHTTFSIEGAHEAVIDVVEVPFLAHFHYDALHFKLMVDAGLYAGYRLGIERRGDNVKDGMARSFATTDLRPEYGLQGGGGIGFVFSPVELHISALVRYSWSSLYEPDSSPSVNNKYYYRFAYPLDVSIMAGVHFQISKRTGRTSADLRRQAMEIVKNGWDIENVETEDNSGKSGE